MKVKPIHVLRFLTFDQKTHLQKIIYEDNGIGVYFDDFVFTKDKGHTIHVNDYGQINKECRACWISCKSTDFEPLKHKKHFGILTIDDVKINVDVYNCDSELPTKRGLEIYNTYILSFNRCNPDSLYKQICKAVWNSKIDFENKIYKPTITLETRQSDNIWYFVYRNTLSFGNNDTSLYFTREKPDEVDCVINNS